MEDAIDFHMYHRSTRGLADQLGPHSNIKDFRKSIVSAALKGE
jgi:hypothetical protein